MVITTIAKVLLISFLSLYLVSQNLQAYVDPPDTTSSTADTVFQPAAAIPLIGSLDRTPGAYEAIPDSFINFTNYRYA